MKWNAILNDSLDVSEPAVAAILSDYVKHAVELDLNESDEIASLMKKNYNVHMCVEITCSVLRLAVAIFDTAVGLNMFRTFFLSL